MSARGFGPILMAAGVAAATLSCYLVSLKVASERAALDRVETQILLAQRDIRLLNTEIGTRGRLAQLERWNARVIRLSAPAEDQFVESGFQLASLVMPERVSPVDAPVVLASAPVAPAPAAPMPAAANGLLHTASFTLPPAKAEVAPPRAPDGDAQPAPAKAAPRAAGAERDVKASPAAKPVAKAAETKAAAAPEPRRAAKSAKTAMADPLAPLPTPGAKAKASRGGEPSKSRPSKDPGTR